MSREPRDGGADVRAVYVRGRSGDYPEPYLTLRDLRLLVELCRDSDKLICNIEAYELVGEHDMERLDMSLFAGSKSHQAQPWGQRVARTTAKIENIIAAAAAERNQIMFVVWLDTKSDT